MGGNLLKSRFLASEAYRAEYLAAYWELYEQIYGDGAVAESVLDDLAATIPLSDDLDETGRSEAVNTLREWVSTRTAALAPQFAEYQS